MRILAVGQVNGDSDGYTNLAAYYYISRGGGDHTANLWLLGAPKNPD
jgi:hypothetical protein